MDKARKMQSIVWLCIIVGFYLLFSAVGLKYLSHFWFTIGSQFFAVAIGFQISIIFCADRNQ